MKITKVTSNKRLRHYTVYLSDGVKIRTVKLNRIEFEEFEYNTFKDWRNYLSFNNSYFVPCK